MGFFMLAEEDAENVVSDCHGETKQSKMKQHMQGGGDLAVMETENQMMTSHSAGDRENYMISAKCDVRLESLALTNEDKDYMRSLIENNNKAELNCTGGDDSNLTSPQMKTREDEKTLWKNKTLKDQELLSTFILERAPSPERPFVEQSNSSTAVLADPVTHNAPTICWSLTVKMKEGRKKQRLC